MKIICPYDTFACKNYDKATILGAVGGAVGEDSANPIITLPESEFFKPLTRLNQWVKDSEQLRDLFVDNLIRFITGEFAGSKRIQIAHPIVSDNNHDRQYLLDLRPFMKWRNKYEPELMGGRLSLFNFELMRTVLMSIYDYDATRLGTVRKFGASVYARWIGSMIARRMDITPEQRVRIEVVCCYYFFTQFYEDDTVKNDGALHNNIVKNVGAVLNIKPTDVLGILDIDYRPTDLHSLVNSFYAVTESERFKEFGVRNLMVTLQSTLMPDKNETVMVGIEHPPTFLTMVYYAVTHADYKRTSLVTMINSFYKPNDKNSFVASMHSAIYS